LRKAIRKLLGESVTLIDTSEAVVRQLKKQLETKSISQASQIDLELTFVSSKDERSLLAMANDLMLSDMSSYRIHGKLLGEIS
jgi:glutamate racemase